MEAFWFFVHITIFLDAVAFAIVFALGMLVAPVVILVDGAFWWKRRLKWMAVALVGSWLGLWMYWRRRPAPAILPPARATFGSQ